MTLAMLFYKYSLCHYIQIIVLMIIMAGHVITNSFMKTSNAVVVVVKQTNTTAEA